jgi:hypothetical protein
MALDHCTACGYEYSKLQHIGCPKCQADRVEKSFSTGVSRKAATPPRNCAMLAELAAAIEKPVALAEVAAALEEPDKLTK